MDSTANEKVKLVKYTPELEVNFADFDCGVDDINHYLQTRLVREAGNRLVIPYMLIAEENNELVGFFTLSSHSVEKVHLNSATKRKVPYQSFSAIMIGKLAVDKKWQGYKFGQRLLSQAVHNGWLSSRDVGTLAMVLHSIEGKEGFYKEAGFMQSKCDPSLFIYPLRQYDNELKKRIGKG
ncbi:GNAT family N-acetyltransferase [Photobacterium leiognathi]|uniref:GNAT family N-acetyltransferase n=1 Tax=Photobacterium leiognathi TaxID=553611 RepID=UPI0029822E9D|nr:GNAT family N-acetyltransferase [Photobacterium leiognathi]